MKAVHVYLTKKSFKITTMYRLESGSYIDSNPIYILPTEVSLEELSNKISSCLVASKQLSEKEEDSYWLGNKLLKLLKESSFNKLYEASNSCIVYTEKNRTIIKPYKFKGKDQGLVVDQDRVVELESNISDIELTKIIFNLLTQPTDDLSIST